MSGIHPDLQSARNYLPAGHKWLRVKGLECDASKYKIAYPTPWRAYRQHSFQHVFQPHTIILSRDAQAERRAMLAALLIDAGIFYLRDHGLEERFIAGEIDPDFDALDMDSLGAMELCIALETSWNLVVVPEELRNIGSLQGIIDLVDV